MAASLLMLSFRWLAGARVLAADNPTIRKQANFTAWIYNRRFSFTPPEIMEDIEHYMETLGRAAREA
ncbi:MAG: hypothetical protein LBD68_06035, partial [Zoogloeaceae bacterium]|nr:hypothetical protein [Zoogloeaceae bacterium]